MAPQHELCSDAVRTRATLALVLPAFSPPPDSIEFCADLYLASPEAMLTRLRQVRAARTVLMVAHNPGTHALALQLAGGGAPKTLAALAVKYPTAGLAVLTFAGAKDWAAVDTGQGLLVHFVTPRTLA